MNDGTPSLPEGFLLHRYDTIGSTNDEARQLAREGMPAGTLVWAAAQSAGRGRRGHLWQSPPGNLYLSMVLRPEAPPANAPQLGFVAALALGDALDQLAGILLESEMAAGGGLDFVILGIGVNLVSAPRDLEYPATSLADQGVSGITPAALLEALTAHFALWAERWRNEGFAPVRAGWLRRASGIGQPVRVRLEKLTLDGRFLDLDYDGALVFEGNDGRRRIAAGEVFPAPG